MSTGAAGELLRQAMASYHEDPARGDFLIEYACTQATDPLPLYRVIYKFYNRQRRIELAAGFAARALRAAALRAGLPDDAASWNRAQLADADPDLASQILLGLKALAFLALRQGDEAAARPWLAHLNRLDPEDGSGASVVAALMESVQSSQLA